MIKKTIFLSCVMFTLAQASNHQELSTKIQQADDLLNIQIGMLQAIFRRDNDRLKIDQRLTETQLLLASIFAISKQLPALNKLVQKDSGLTKAEAVITQLSFKLEHLQILETLMNDPRFHGYTATMPTTESVPLRSVNFNTIKPIFEISTQVRKIGEQALKELQDKINQ